MYCACAVLSQLFVCTSDVDIDVNKETYQCSLGVEVKGCEHAIECMYILAVTHSLPPHHPPNTYSRYKIFYPRKTLDLMPQAPLHPRVVLHPPPLHLLLPHHQQERRNKEMGRRERKKSRKALLRRVNVPRSRSPREVSGPSLVTKTLNGS